MLVLLPSKYALKHGQRWNTMPRKLAEGPSERSYRKWAICCSPGCVGHVVEPTGHVASSFQHADSLAHKECSSGPSSLGPGYKLRLMLLPFPQEMDYSRTRTSRRPGSLLRRLQPKHLLHRQTMGRARGSSLFVARNQGSKCITPQACIHVWVSATCPTVFMKRPPQMPKHEVAGSLECSTTSTA